jgi:hypothetical protein
VGTAATPHTGSIPTAVSGSGSAGFGTGTGGGFGGGGGAPGGGGSPGGSGSGFGGAGRTGDGAPNPGSAEAGPGSIGSGTRGSSGPPSGASGELGDLGGGSAGGFGGAGPGGIGTSSALDQALEKTTTRWAAAVEGSNSAASLELASGGKAVMAMGGFTGTDPAPTLAEFEQWARAGDITYYIAGGGMGGGPGGQGTSSQITAWVKGHYKSATIGGETVYLLLRPKS